MVGHKVSFSTAHAEGTDCISMMNTQMAVPRGHPNLVMLLLTLLLLCE
jgi:hypothetical protein